MIDLLPPSAVTTARTALAELGPAPDDGSVARVSSDQSNDRNYRSRASSAGRRSLPVWLEAHDVCFVVTWPGDFSGTGIHHSGSRIEPDLPWLEVDVALDAADAENGQIWLVPGSHLWFSETSDEPVDDSVAEVLALRYGRSVELAPGQALISSPATLRFSLPNRDRPRRSLEFRTPAPEQLLSPPATQHSLLARHLDSEKLKSLDAAGHAFLSDRRPHEPCNPSRVHCLACGTLLPAEPTPHPWNRVVAARCSTCTVGGIAPITARPSAPALSPEFAHPLPELPLPVLREPEFDSRLRSNGFVVLPESVISAAAAERLRDAFGELRQWKGRGHLNDFNERDRPYRDAATLLMKDHLIDVLSPLFTDHEPFLCTFLCKWPGEESDLEPHQDWMYVDERKGERTFLAFVALDDISADRGQLRVLPGSHRLDSRPRGTDLRPPWLGHSDVLERRMETISLSAGQCAIWNSALVHSSLPNMTATPRVAAGMWFARKSTPLVHFRRADPTRAAFFEIDADFYRTQNPYRLMVSHPPYPVREVVPTAGRDLTPEELEQSLDEINGGDQHRPPRRSVGRFGLQRRR